MYIISSYDKMQLTGDMAVNYRQEANFFWLTKINHPGWMVVRDEVGVDRLVRPEVSEIEKQFDGYLSDEEAVLLSGIKEVWSRSEFDDWLVSLEQGSEVGALKPLASEGYGMVMNPSDERVWRMVEEAGHQPRDIRSDFAKQRAIKTQAEVELMQESIDLTAEMLSKLKSGISSYESEAELAADITAGFMRDGAIHAYDPIVAGGGNACTLHYVANNQPLSSGQMVLIDVGASIGGYNADLTRTFAIGEVSERYRAVHMAVERILKTVINLIRPNLTFKDYMTKVDEIVLSELFGLGLADGVDDKPSLRRYMPHSISHGLGIDVHESLSPHEEFQPGMILTVEPGIYIPDENIGVRIEDNILVTEDGHLNMSAHLPTSM